MDGRKAENYSNNAQRIRVITEDWVDSNMFCPYCMEEYELKSKGALLVIRCYMWVHLTGELSPDPKIIVDEYQKTRHSDHPKEYYKNFKGILVTDGLAQYHKIARKLEHLGNANCGDNKPYSRTGIRLTVNENMQKS